MISEKTLKKWRKEALEDVTNEYPINVNPESLNRNIRELQQRILRLTQEQLDQHLMRRKS